MEAGDTTAIAAVEDWNVPERAVAELARVGLPVDLDRRVATLSVGGEAVLAGPAGLLVRRPAITLLDEPTNNLDPVSRAQVLDALRSFAGAIVLVTHDEGAVEALRPERVILLPDGIEDAWNEDFADLVALA